MRTVLLSLWLPTRTKRKLVKSPRPCAHHAWPLRVGRALLTFRHVQASAANCCIVSVRIVVTAARTFFSAQLLCAA